RYFDSGSSSAISSEEIDWDYMQVNYFSTYPGGNCYSTGQVYCCEISVGASSNTTGNVGFYGTWTSTGVTIDVSDPTTEELESCGPILVYWVASDHESNYATGGITPTCDEMG